MFPYLRFSERFDRALVVAALAHQPQLRKGTRIPYLMHPVHVAVLLQGHGFQEPVVLAGLLHDVLEDIELENESVRAAFAETFSELSDRSFTPDRFREALRGLIVAEFGVDVLAMVEAVTELKEADSRKRPWRTRKDEQIVHGSTMEPGAAAVKAADALHNAYAILRDVESQGLKALERFNCSPQETLWYYGSVADVVRDRIGEQHSLVLELDEIVYRMTEAIHSLLEPQGAVERCPFCGSQHVPARMCASAGHADLRVENAEGQRIYSIAHWRRLAPPVGKDVQWVNGRSAKEAARAWSQMRPPSRVLELLRTGAEFADLTIATAVAELVTSLDTFGEGRHHDLVLFASAREKRILVGLEAKSDEELGPIIADYLERTARENEARAEAGRQLSRVPQRIESLTRLVFGSRQTNASNMRYQLLHGLGGTLIEASRRGADVAVFVVHEFASQMTAPSKVLRNEADVSSFADAVAPGTSDTLRHGRLAGPFEAGGSEQVPRGFPFYLGLAKTEL